MSASNKQMQNVCGLAISIESIFFWKVPAKAIKTSCKSNQNCLVYFH